MSQMNEKGTYRRRHLLQTIAALASPGALAGCSLFVRKPTPVCPDSPEVSRPTPAPLTIDAHCHIFNGSDLQVNGFITRILARQGGIVGVGARAIGPLLQGIGWQVAPSGKAEVKRLNALARELQTCSKQQHRQRVVELKEQAYDVGRTSLQTALQNSVEMQQFKQLVQVQGIDLAQDEVARARSELIAAIEGLPKGVQNYKTFRANSGLTLLSHQRSARGMLDFVLQNFQYRYVSVYDYLETYDKPSGSRFIDLMLPSMVDYDYWLASGESTPTTLPSQVDVMETVSVVTGGRVHAFVPFDPLRQVAFKLRLTSTDSFTLAKNAIEGRGSVGVKLYPPMGFAAYGNADLPKSFWRRDWLPSWTARPEMGELLDQALFEMLSWCAANEVPVMAHTGLSNGPSTDFEELAGSKYWSKVLDQVKGLRVSFGHFGDSSLGEDGEVGLDRASGFTALMGDGAQAKGRNAYADAGYFVDGLLQQPKLLAALRQLYEQTAPGRAPLSIRFMYGTDWEMTLAEGSVIDSYLDQFVALFDEMEKRPAIKSQGVTKLAERFFGHNAVEWVGLRPGERARERLDRFYEAKGVAKPDWMQKVDARWA
jgi:predicted TIM-barrel fold metal-dependent hydrolase